MIINNLGVLNLEQAANGCNTSIDPHSMAFVVTSSDGLETSGKLDNAQYIQFDPQGQPPYDVKVGFQNWSYYTTVNGLQSGDYAISFTNIYPVGTGLTGNGPQAFVNKPAGKSTLSNEAGSSGSSESGGSSGSSE